MKIIKSVQESLESGLPDPIRGVVLEEMEEFTRIVARGKTYDPARHGFMVVVEPEDSESSVREALGHPLHEAPLSGCTMVDGVYLTCLPWSARSGLAVAVVDHENLAPRTRGHLETLLQMSA